MTQRSWSTTACAAGEVGLNADRRSSAFCSTTLQISMRSPLPRGHQGGSREARRRVPLSRRLGTGAGRRVSGRLGMEAAGEPSRAREKNGRRIESFFS
jgi:hypothetical protein